MSDQVKQSWWFEVDCPKKGPEYILLSVVATGMLPHEVTEAAVRTLPAASPSQKPQEG